MRGLLIQSRRPWTTMQKLNSHMSFENLFFFCQDRHREIYTNFCLQSRFFVYSFCLYKVQSWVSLP